MDKTIHIAKDFTRYPGPRYAQDGPFSGEAFRDGILSDALDEAIKSGGVVNVFLDDVAGYGSSFLEEAFGGLVRKGFTPQQLKEHLRIAARTSRFQHHVRTAQRYIDEAVAVPTH